MNKNKGFTLIELLVVIAIIGLLSSIVFASVSAARDKAQISKAKVQTKEIEKAIELSRLSANNLYPINTTHSSIEDLPINSEAVIAIKDSISSGIPEVPKSSLNENIDSEYYYISDGIDASDGEVDYICGVSNAQDHLSSGKNRTPEGSVIFYPEQNLVSSEEQCPACSIPDYDEESTLAIVKGYEGSSSGFGDPFENMFYDGLYYTGFASPSVGESYVYIPYWNNTGEDYLHYGYTCNN